MPETAFAKMHGQGNDFVVLDGIADPGLAVDGRLAKALADRHCGVGADQVLLVSARPQPGEFNYRIFNADGGEVSQCGNGARSVLQFAQRRGYAERAVVLHTGAGAIEVCAGVTGPRAQLAVPKFAPPDIPCAFAKERRWHALDWHGRQLALAVVNLGNPHAVLWIDDCAAFPLDKLGADLNAGAEFPEGVNVSVATRDPQDDSFAMRVYERGVGLTQACGSAACACAAVAWRDLALSSIAVKMPGGALFAGWDGGDSAAWIEGAVAHVFDGKVSLAGLAGRDG